MEPRNLDVLLIVITYYYSYSPSLDLHRVPLDPPARLHLHSPIITTMNHHITLSVCGRQLDIDASPNQTIDLLIDLLEDLDLNSIGTYIIVT